MQIALGSDEKTPLTDALEKALRERGCRVQLHGALAEDADDSWPSVGTLVANAVAGGSCESGIVCCWSGTGVSIAANKVPGIRAALCGDAETAALARTWNDANVLALSLRVTPPDAVDAILDRWFAAEPTSDPRYRAMIDRVSRT
ncbi:MAG TPA: RpiB/LacA/LacB family sugar-phosphate isomerase [Candidatus Baltobacteraceae bacterium]|nr:RpiB/LacA/LacB family sugar-phosphate isomerase [Candidatus Baltobacteraceae bacterium]